MRVLREDPAQCRRLLCAVDVHHELFGLRCALASFVLDAHVARLLLVLGAQRANRGRERGRKEDGLPFGRQRLQDFGDVFLKAHVQHAVRFVEHDRRHAMYLQGAALQVVQDASRRAHDQVHALFERARLIAHGLATGQHYHRQPGQIATQLAQLAQPLARSARASGRR